MSLYKRLKSRARKAFLVFALSLAALNLLADPVRAEMVTCKSACISVMSSYAINLTQILDERHYKVRIDTEKYATEMELKKRAVILLRDACQEMAMPYAGILVQSYQEASGDYAGMPIKGRYIQDWERTRWNSLKCSKID